MERRMRIGRLASGLSAHDRGSGPTGRARPAASLGRGRRDGACSALGRALVSWEHSMPSTPATASGWTLPGQEAHASALPEVSASSSSTAGAAESADTNAGSGPDTSAVAPTFQGGSLVPSDSPAISDIRRWIGQIRSTPSVAAAADEASWRRHMDIVRTGMTGTAACLSLAPQRRRSVSSPAWPRAHEHERVESECAICLEPLGPVDERRLLPCGHTFHVKCAAQWLQCRPRCPICRHSPFLPAQEHQPLAPAAKVP